MRINTDISIEEMEKRFSDIKIDEKDILFGIYRRGDNNNMGTKLCSEGTGDMELIIGTLIMTAVEIPSFLKMLKSVVYTAEMKGDEIRRIMSKHKADGTMCVSDGSKGKILS